MAKEPHSFKRLVLGLQPSAPDRTMQLAVELTDLLHLDLLGLFLEDTSLRDLASFPFAREFRPLGGGWHSIDLDRLSQDVELAARSIERMFTDAGSAYPRDPNSRSCADQWPKPLRRSREPTISS